ncbi:MAG TPA: hypothetical protein VH561_00170 [Micromonosporaceae bacterium]|jgi:hypothetical protein
MIVFPRLALHLLSTRFQYVAWALRLASLTAAATTGTYCSNVGTVNPQVRVVWRSQWVLTCWTATQG